jgi:trans-aconitate methyltransferase
MTKQQYKWDAKDYENHSRSQQIWGLELLSKLKLETNKHVLDIGCGDGKITAEIAGIVKNGNVIGIDSSEEMIKLAKNKYPPDSNPNLHFRILDARQLDYRDEFNVVFSNAVFHWIDDHKSLLHRINLCLRRGGRTIIQMGGKGNASEIIQVMSALIDSPTWKTFFKNFKFPYYFYNVEEYSAWVDQTGFSKSRIDLISKYMNHEGPEELEGWIRTTWLPYLQPIPKNLRNKFIREFVKKYLDTFPADENGIVQVKMVRLEVELTKQNN